MRMIYSRVVRSHSRSTLRLEIRLFKKTRSRMENYVAWIKINKVYSWKLNMTLIHCVDFIFAETFWIPSVKIGLKPFHLDKGACRTKYHTTTTTAGFSWVTMI
jgi:hypothetical protein